MIATTQDQAARLLRCGVSADTADMTLRTETGEVNFSRYSLETELKFYGYDGPKRHIEIIPAWSLSALLTKVLPSKIVKKNEYHIWLTYELKITTENSEWCAVYESCEDSIDLGQSIIDVLFFTEASDPIEACVLMAEKLTNNGYKLNEQ